LQREGARRRLPKWIQPHPEFERPVAAGQSRAASASAKRSNLIAACFWANHPRDAGRK